MRSIHDIERDIQRARRRIEELPAGSRRQKSMRLALAEYIGERYEHRFISAGPLTDAEAREEGV